MPRAFPLIVFGCVIAAVVAVSSAMAAEESRGANVYREKCASCHGGQGEGVADEHPTPLLGDRSIRELTQYITKTMPKGSEGDCVGEEAAAVAEYIHHEFYSPLAQARNKPARIELSRLTVRQYQESVADLIGSFRWTNKWGDERGLKGTYAKSRKTWDRNDRVLERVDSVIDFDFGESSPVPEGIDPKEFAMRWEGSVLAPETGDYDFVVRTDNAVKLFVNDTNVPLVDAWVRSGKDTDFAGTIRLLGGRAYPLRIEYYKSREKRASIALLWKPPHQVLGVIPARALSTQSFPSIYVVGTPFPPDDRSIGYERGTSISKEWDAAATTAAIETADYVLKDLRELAGIKRDTQDRDAKYREFCHTFAERAFRRPLNPDERQLYVDRHFEEEGVEGVVAVKRCLLLTLLSPRFLYRELGPTDDGYDRAARLSFALWDSLPDRSLIEAAAKNELKSEGDLRWRADQMLGDLRTQAKLREFLRQWLKLDHLDDIAKDPSKYPEFDAATIADLRTSLELFIDDVVWRDGGNFRKLLLDESLYLNPRLMAFFGTDVPADALLPPDSQFQKVSLESNVRAGVLSHPYLLAGFAYTSSTSPIHRGVFIARNVLGRSLRTPPVAVAPLAPDLHADLTTRERVELQTQADACQSCHNMINPLGFTLEHFDAVGRYRREEQGKPIDATGTYITRSGQEAKFGGVRELATFLASSDETHQAFVEQLFHYTVKQPIRAYGPEVTADLTKKFVAGGYDIRKLLVDISLVAALTPATNQP
jgi:cytochrome c553